MSPPGLSARQSRYELIRSLAAGGMAEVFLARVEGAAGFSKLVALKRIHAQLADDPTFVARFIDEARLASRLNHPNIVQIFDLGIAEGAYFIAMEYVHGKTLWDLCREGARRNQFLPVDFTLGVLVAACEGLGFAHDQRSADGSPLGIVHRDVSPQNLLVSFDGAIKVADFGIARAAGNAHKTEVGAVVGKLSYMSPEQMRGERVDRRADVFALGVILHELLCLQKLWSPKDDPSTRPRPTPPSLVNRAVPKALDAIVERALADDTDARYPSCDALREDLEAVMAAQGMVNSARRRADLMQAWFPEEARPPVDPGAPIAARKHDSMPTISIEHSMIEGAATVSDPDTAPQPAAPVLGSVTSDPSSSGDRTYPALASVPLGASQVVTPAPPTRPRAFSEAPTTVSRLPEARKAIPLPPTPEHTPAEVVGRRRLRWALAASATLFCGAALYAVTRPPQPTAFAIAASPTPSPSPSPAPSPSSPPSPSPPPSAFASPSPSPSPAPAPAPSASASPSPAPEPSLEPSPHALTAATAHRRREEPARPAPRPKGALTLSSTPQLQVYLGKSLLGQTPLRDVPLPAGRQRLRMVSRAAGIDLPLEVEVSPGETVTRSVTIGKSRLRIKVLPWAQVSVDGNDLGTTPLAPQSLYAGTHSIVLTYKPEGGAPKVKREQLTLKEGEDRLLEADLR